MARGNRRNDGRNRHGFHCCHTAGPRCRGGTSLLRPPPIRTAIRPNSRPCWGIRRLLNSILATRAQATLLVDDGARHVVVPGYHLGAGVDTETDGHPSDLANGDDSSPADDEDGVVFLTALTQSALAGIEVTASARGYLDAWIDFNNDGHFGDANEQIFTSRLLSPGANTLYFSVPGSATVASVTHARFRFSTEGGLSPTGLAADGEVEDYAVTIQPGNVPPVAVDDDATAEPGIAVEINVASNDTDSSGDLVATSVVVLLPPAHGVATVDPLTGIVSYTSEAGFAGNGSIHL